MKKRLHDKKAGIALLLSLIIISVAEAIFRSVVMREAALTTANLGEQLAVIALAVTILILTAKGADRACYICYGAWIAYFVLDQLFELPGAVVGFISLISQSATTTIVPFLLRIIGMICIVAIGVILVEYMTDGTIFNRAFNALSIITILAFVAYAVIVVCGIIDKGVDEYWLAVFDIVYNIIMVFLFTFFAYDSAKHQLKKTDLTK